MFQTILEFVDAMINGLPLNQWYPCDNFATPDIELCPPAWVELIPAESGVVPPPPSVELIPAESGTVEPPR